jgi:hypothetical protein
MSGPLDGTTFVSRRDRQKPRRFSAMASLAGSAAAVEVAHASHYDSPVWIGTLAGLFSSILMALLMMAYYMNPETGELKSTKHK